MPLRDEIADFYDSHPYPPPVENLEKSLEGWDETRKRVEHFRHWPTVPYTGGRDILVAGCGTSQAARWAARYPEATVVGIDVSRSSLDAERRLAERHGLDNLELRQLSIEEAADLRQTFDQIICTGVLHHLTDPVLGLKALRSVMAADGALQLMVYAAYGRFGIDMMRDYGRRLGLGTTEEEMEELRRTLTEIPLGHPMSHVLREARDFQDPDALADALLNPRERSYTVPQVFDLLNSGGFRFARWVRQAPYRPQCGIMSRLAHGERIALMADDDQYAAMELFRGTISRHSLIAYRDDSTLPSPLLEWEGDSWRDYVALIPPTVVGVEDGVPPGIAAAVINRDHVDRDLVCFLGSDELSLFRAIDGETRLGDLAGVSAGLTERLWMHDLVMIDASKPSATP
jgi:SAM-dependent methyltransferase